MKVYSDLYTEQDKPGIIETFIIVMMNVIFAPLAFGRAISSKVLLTKERKLYGIVVAAVSIAMLVLYVVVITIMRASFSENIVHIGCLACNAIGCSAFAFWVRGLPDISEDIASVENHEQIEEVRQSAGETGQGVAQHDSIMPAALASEISDGDDVDIPDFEIESTREEQKRDSGKSVDELYGLKTEMASIPTVGSTIIQPKSAPKVGSPLLASLSKRDNGVNQDLSAGVYKSYTPIFSPSPGSIHDHIESPFSNQSSIDFGDDDDDDDYSDVGFGGIPNDIPPFDPTTENFDML